MYKAGAGSNLPAPAFHSAICYIFTFSIALSEEKRYNLCVRHNKKCNAGTGCWNTPPPAYGAKTSIGN